MMGDPPVTLESLDFEWGDAYLICYARDQWAALRRDTRRFLQTGSLVQGVVCAGHVPWRQS